MLQLYLATVVNAPESSSETLELVRIVNCVELHGMFGESLSLQLGGSIAPVGSGGASHVAATQPVVFRFKYPS